MAHFLKNNGHTRSILLTWYLKEKESEYVICWLNCSYKDVNELQLKKYSVVNSEMLINFLYLIDLFFWVFIIKRQGTLFASCS